MSMRVADRLTDPELFKNSRPEFNVAMVCDCGWSTIAQREKDARETARVHAAHFCSNRCG